MNKLTVSPSPHVHSGDSVKKNMYGVIIALMPALLASLWFFGVGALVVTLTSVAACLLFEFLIQKYLLNREPSVLDGSAIITGLLLAFNLPSNLPIALIIIGAAVSIGIGKMAFGGLGNNPFNPALVGRVFLLISFPVQMTSWPLPIASRMSYVDALTGATPLAVLKEGVKSGQSMTELTEKIPSSINLFLGNMGGSLGEVAAIALIIGLAYMLIRRIITWHIPVSVIATVLVFTGILHLVDPQQYVSPLFHLLTGGLLLGAIFMATDYVTSPMSHPGMIVFGVGIGVITVLIRVFGAYPEGVSFAILIMNAFTPLINKYIKPKAFGEVAKPVKA
ncbi:MAG: RnfABCDGE type electron transport complex subunit D [Marinilabiliaceae bacterium]|nr:RnfABCDGE type electron transport complex subunit D [Marinilabiliaceae bacterium]